MKVLVACLVFLGIGYQANANPNENPIRVKNEIRRLLADISGDLDTAPADGRTLERVRRQLERTLEVLRSNEVRSEPPRRFDPVKPLECVSRDNDGLSPYVLAYRGDDFSTTKLSGVFRTLQQCQATQQNGRRLETSIVLCQSRDNDGLAPYVISIYDFDSRSEKILSVVKSLENCLTSVRSAQLSRTHAAFCVSRDNDGLSPFLRMIYGLKDQSISKDTVTYSKMESCISGNR